MLYDRVRPFFFCETTRIHKTGCITDKVYEDDLSVLVLGLVRKYAEIALCAESILVQLRANSNSDMAKLVDDMASLQVAIDKSKSSKVALYESYKEGKLTKDIYMEEKNHCEDGIAIMQNRMEKIKFELEALRGEPYSNQFVDSFKTLHQLVELTPQLVSDLVDNIKIYAVDDVGVTWNFVDDYERVFRLLEAEAR